MGFLSDFLGGSAKKDLRAAQAQSNAALDKGYADAQGYSQQALDTLDPYAQQGLTGQTSYFDALGLGTPEGQAKSQAAYFNDPAMQQVLGQSSNALLRKLNSGGSGTGGGKLALAGTRVGLDGYNQYLNRLQGLGTQGLATAGQQSSIQQGQGELAFGFGATKAGSAISFGNAMAANRNTGINNLLNTAGTASKFFNPGAPK